MDKKFLYPALPLIFMIILSFKPNSDIPPGNGNNGNFPNKLLSNPNQIFAIDSKKLDANQISTWFRTNGSYNRDPSTGNQGFEWPKGSGKFARYAGGLWLGCIVGNDTLTAVASFTYDFVPGYVDNDGNAAGQEEPAYRIYKITQGNTTDADYLNWPINQGAYTDSLGRPLFLGTQTMFYVYNDAATHASGQTSLASMKAQILQTNWSYNVNGPLGNIVFMEYRIINRSNNTWTNTYLGSWCDDDLGNENDDKIGCDTTLNLGYTYNSTNNDADYGSAPPAVGTDFFRGALINTGDLNDTVRYFSPPGTENEVIKVGYRDLGLTVFNCYNNGNPPPSDPQNNTETFRVLEGKQRLNESWVNPNNGDTTKIIFTGDPVTSTGWINPGEADRRFIQSTGPFVMNAGDTQTIIVAQVIARGNSNLGSVAALRSTDALAQRIFDNNFQVPESAPEVPVSVYAPGNGKIYISWGDSAERISIHNKLSGGTYEFQGYNIYAIKPGTTGSEPSDRVLMKTFDKVDGVGDIMDSVFNTTYGTFIYYVVQPGTNNGISRYFVMERDFINNNNIYNGTEYPIVVTAYYYDSLGGPFSAPKVNETPITFTNTIKVIPQNLTLGTEVSYGVGDTIQTTQRDLGTMPIVIDPLKLINASYTSTYGGTPAVPTWTLTRTINGNTETLFQDQTDFTGLQDTARTINGFLLVHDTIKDSGVVRDPEDATTSRSTFSKVKAWTYEPENNLWLRGPDTTAVLTAKVITNRQFESRSLGMSFPTTGTFKNNVSRIKANGSFFTPVTAGSPILTGGPLRKIQFIFGQTSMAYRFVPTDTNYNNLPFNNMAEIPFSVYAIDELDSSGGDPRQLNVGFMDADNSGNWNPDTTALGGYEFTYVLASSYDPNPNSNYTNKNPGLSSPALGFPAMDVMYAWLPRARNVNGVKLTWSAGDKLTVTPYRITKNTFVPGYPIKYSWDVRGTDIGNTTVASGQMDQIKAFPNPYYGGSRLESDPFDRFIYLNHLPSKCKIFVYTLDGVLVKSIDRSNNDPNNSLEKWDMKNQNEIPVASGMYIIFIDAPGIGTKTLKVAIFTPQERLDTF